MISQFAHEIINYDSEGITIQGSAGTQCPAKHKYPQDAIKFFIKNGLLLIKFIKKILYGNPFLLVHTID